MTLTIGSLVLTRANGYVVGTVTRSVVPNYITTGTFFSAFKRQVGMAVNEVMEWTIPVYFQADSAAALASLVRNLNAELTHATTITDDMGGDTVTWDTWPSAPVTPGPSGEANAAHQFKADVTLRTKAQGYGSPVTLYTSEAVTGPALLSLGDLEGDAPAPLTLDVNATWDTSGNGIQDCWVGLCKTGTLTDYQYDAEDAAASGSWVAAIDGMKTNEPTNWDILDFGEIPAGTYRVASRSKIITGETGWLALSVDGYDAYSVKAITTDEYRIFDLGQFTSTGHTHLFLLGKGSDWVYCEKLLFFPAEDQVTSFHWEDTGNIDSWQLDSAPTLTKGGGDVLPARKYMNGEQLVCPCPARWLLVWAGDDNGAQYDPGLAVSVSYVPQYWSWA